MDELRRYPVEKLCSTPKCGVIWTGESFTERKPGDPPIRAKCALCVDRHQQAVARIASRVRDVIVRRRADPTADQDQPYPPLRRVG